MAKKKVYIGLITKGKRKGRKGFVSLENWIKQNKEKIVSGEIVLTDTESKVFRKVVKNEKISLKAELRFRYKGKFLNSEQQKFLTKQLKQLDKPFTQENINEYFEKEIFYTYSSLEVTDIIMNHDGEVKINGETMDKASAIVEFNELNNENYIEWSDQLEIRPTDIFFIIYDATFKPSTKTLDIDTMVNDETRIIASDPEQAKKRKAEKAKQRRLDRKKK